MRLSLLLHRSFIVGGVVNIITVRAVNELGQGDIATVTAFSQQGILASLVSIYFNSLSLLYYS